MPLHVKDGKTDRLVRELARNRGIGITEAIRTAVEESLAADKLAAREPVKALRRRLQPLLNEMARYPKDGGTIDKQFFDDMWVEEGMD